MTSLDPGTRQWSPRARQVTVRVVLLGCAYVGGAALVVAAVRYHGGSTYGIATTNGHRTRITLPATTFYAQNPGPARIVMGVLAGAALVSTASLTWRVVRHSPKVSVAGMAVGSALGVVGILGLLTIGLVLLPVAALLVVVALPLDVFGNQERGPAATAPRPPQGGGGTTPTVPWSPRSDPSTTAD